MCAKQTAGNRTPRVLVVEDDPAVARMLHLFLRAAGFEVTERAGGAEALRVLEQESPDAVVLDLVLPDNQGAAVLDRLRQKGNHELPAWVVISTLDQGEATSRYGSFGNHFLGKPFDPKHLLGMLRAALPECKDGEQNRRNETAG